MHEEVSRGALVVALVHGSATAHKAYGPIRIRKVVLLLHRIWAVSFSA